MTTATEDHELSVETLPTRLSVPGLKSLAATSEKNGTVRCRCPSERH